MSALLLSVLFPEAEILLTTVGPWLVLGLAAAETAFFTGLVVPAGVVTALAALLASQGFLDLWIVAAAATAGALVGDSSGYWLGRTYGRGLLRGPGRILALARSQEPRIAALFSRHPIYAVSFGRIVSFVRTLMPWMAGMTGLSYPRFLFYDVLGILGWALLYLSVGYLAGESWRWLSGAVGTGGAILFLLLGLGGWLWAQRRHLRDPEGGGLGPSAETPAVRESGS